MKKDHVQNQIPKGSNKFQETYRTESLTFISQMILQGYFLVKKILHYLTMAKTSIQKRVSFYYARKSFMLRVKRC